MLHPGVCHRRLRDYKGERPLVVETPERLLDDETTPISKFFIRNNGQLPEFTDPRLTAPRRKCSPAFRA